jgi:hypothetical protein
MQLDPSDLPPLTRIRQVFPRPRVADPAAELRRELEASGVRLKSGGSYAIAVGSRGIANLALLLKGLVDWVKDRGGRPFLVPAMGSHGGATAAGQREVLESYGVTEAAMGAPIRSSMETVELPREGLELPTYFDRHAASADGTLILNRIKPHTCFHGRYESGLMKMLVIGLGKHRQALAVHRHQTRGLVELLPQLARNILKHANVLLGVGLVENACHETCVLRAIPAAHIPEAEPALLAMALAHMPRLPVDRADLLIVDRIGKDLSGTGLDPNVIGRMGVYDQPDPPAPRVRIILVRDLTEVSHGNALGVGLADVCTRRLADKINWAATYENTSTSTFLDRSKLPVVGRDDSEALAFALRAIGPVPRDELRILRIRDTLWLEQVLVSPRVLADLQGREDIQVLGPAGDWFRGAELTPW